MANERLLLLAAGAALLAVVMRKGVGGGRGKVIRDDGSPTGYAVDDPQVGRVPASNGPSELMPAGQLYYDTSRGTYQRTGIPVNQRGVPINSKDWVEPEYSPGY